MILPRFRRNPNQASIAALYGAIVAQARRPAFYDRCGVPDTALGRFDMVVLHCALLLRRLRAADAAAQALGQGVFDAFCRDMDDNLREMGVSDVGVPREMRKLAEAFYGRARAYDAALDADGDAALAAALTRNLYADAAPLPVAVAALTAYVRAATRMLAAEDDAAIAGGAVRFPDSDRSFAAAAG